MITYLGLDMHETLPQCAKFRYTLTSNFKRCFEKYVPVQNFKYKPEFTDHDVLVKIFTFVVFNVLKII